MNAKLVEEIANSVLYEGYILYPYRPSAIKNRQRFNFGALAPRDYCEVHANGENWFMQTECLVRGDSHTSLGVRARCLQLIARTVEKIRASLGVFPSDAQPQYEPVEALEVNARLFQTWQEAVECDVRVSVRLGDVLFAPLRHRFQFDHKEETDLLRDVDDCTAGRIVRLRESVHGEVEMSAECVQPGLFKVRVRISNITPVAEAHSLSRGEALMRSLVSAHAILEVRSGEFISLLDPPAELQDLAAECRNIGNWPVMVGAEGERDAVLASPIILYDYPQIAPESVGDFCDGTEIDEMLALRVLTLTDQEKQEMRQGDERARRILERTETLPDEQLAKLHGALRGMRSVHHEAK